MCCSGGGSMDKNRTTVHSFKSCEMSMVFG